jgi:hypothetical protein
MMNNQEKTARESNLEIKNHPIESLNGIWVPTPVGEEVVYASEANHDRWMYIVKNGERQEWWMGTTTNKNQRRAWGWFREVKRNDNYVEPWNVTSWRWYNSATENWTLIDNVDVMVMTRQNIITRAVKIKADKIRRECDEQIAEIKHEMARVREFAQSHMKVSSLLFNNLTTEERRKLIDKSEFRAIFRAEDLCSVCFSKDKTTKCVHADCTGACAKCRGGDQDAACCACGKEQILECPVCMESHPPSFMNRFPCLHAVCWRCHCKSYEAKKPILKCPMCRKNI